MVCGRCWSNHHLYPYTSFLNPSPSLFTLHTSVLIREFCQVFGGILTHGLTVLPEGGTKSAEFSSTYILLHVVIWRLPQALRFCQSLLGVMNCSSEVIYWGLDYTDKCWRCIHGSTCSLPRESLGAERSLSKYMKLCVRSGTECKVFQISL